MAIHTIQAIHFWLNDASRDQVMEILKDSAFDAWFDRLQPDSDNADAEGRYINGVDVEKWFQALIKDIG